MPCDYEHDQQHHKRRTPSRTPLRLRVGVAPMWTGLLGLSKHQVGSALSGRYLVLLGPGLVVAAGTSRKAAITGSARMSSRHKPRRLHPRKACRSARAVSPSQSFLSTNGSAHIELRPVGPRRYRPDLDIDLLIGGVKSGSDSLAPACNRKEASLRATISYPQRMTSERTD